MLSLALYIKKKTMKKCQLKDKFVIEGYSKPTVHLKPCLNVRLPNEYLPTAEAYTVCSVTDALYHQTTPA